MEKLRLAHQKKPVGSIKIPGSKSISNRILLLSALCSGETEIQGLLESDDTFYMRKALITLGLEIKTEKINGETCYKVMGCGGNFPQTAGELFLGNAGTAFRSLTAVLAVLGGKYELIGVERMHERPIKDLVDALTEFGCQITYLQNEGYPPLLIGKGEIKTDVIHIKGNVSSQFLSALLIALPLTKKALTIEIVGELISKPYVDMTINLLGRFGIKIINHNWKKFEMLPNQSYQSPQTISVESDASSASYFLAAGAIAGDVTVKGVDQNSIQGDVKFAEALARMGAHIFYEEGSIRCVAPENGLNAIEFDCIEIPDAAMTLAIVALFAKGTTRLFNIGSWRVKETDRIHAMVTELTRLGADVKEGQDFIEITPNRLIPEVEIKTYDDHRIAMCFSLVSLAVPIIILDPKCVNKTYPHYFEDFERILA